MKKHLYKCTPWWLPGAILLLALGVRLYALDAQSLWADEGTSLALALRSPAQIVQDTAQDVHPPVYYLFLHAWIALFGDSVIAVRGFSVVCSVLAVLATLVLGGRWFGASVGLSAGVLAALAPLAIYYAQETRMYALVMLCAACAWLALDSWLRAPHWSRLLFYTLAVAVGLGAHFFMAATVLALNLVWFVVVLRQRRLLRRTTLAWLAANALPALLYLPLVWRNRALLSNWSEIARDSFGPLYVLEDTLRTFTQGLFASGWSFWMLLAFVLLLAGLLQRPQVPVLPTAIPDGRLPAALWLAVPVAAMALLAFNQPYYQPRFMLPALPAFHLLVGWGIIAALRRIVVLWGNAARSQPATSTTIPVLVVILIALGNAWQPLDTMWHSPNTRRDDFRGMAHDIAATAGPDDAIMALGQSQLDTLRFYDRTLPQPYLLPRVRPLDEAAVLADLEQIAQRHRRLYALFYVPYEADPGGLIRGWLDANAFRAGSRWYGGVELAIYEFGEPRSAQTPTHLRYTGDLALQRLTRMPARVPPGDAVRITLAWLPNAPLDRPLSLFLHLVNPQDTIVAQFDGPPTNIPTSTWQPGTEQISRVAIIVPPDTPVGDYRILIGLYDPANGMRVPLLHGEELVTVLTGVEVAAR